MAARYARAQAFLPGHVMPRLFLAQVKPQWLEGGRLFWYRRASRGGIEYVLVDCDSGQRRPAFDHAALAAVLDAMERGGIGSGGNAAVRVAPQRLPIELLHVEPDGMLRFAWKSGHWTWRPGDAAALAAAMPAANESLSPDGRWAVSVREHDLHLRDTRSGETRRLTHDGQPHHAYGVMAGACLSAVRDRLLERAPGEGRPPVVAWAPDSSRLATWRVDEREVRELQVQQSVPPAGSARPVWHRYRMPLVGDEVLPEARLVIVDLPAATVRPVQAPPLTRFTFDPFATRLAWWSADGARLHALHTPRGGRRVSLHCIDAASGAGEEVIAEDSETPVFPHHVPLANTNVHELAGAQGEAPRWIWFSQRSGWGHLELHGGAPGSEPLPLTNGAWTVRDVLHVDAQAGWIYFTACGREAGRDPYLRHGYRVRTDASALQLLTPEDGDHEIVFAPDGRHFVDTFSRIDQPPVSVLRRADGEQVALLETADIDALTRLGAPLPQRVVVKARDGVTDLHGCLFVPSDFDPARRYPLVDSIYPGPQMIRAPKAFAGGEASRLYWQDQALAELGFVVLTLDGFGTPFRSKAFVDRAAGRDFGEAGGLADHVAAIGQLAERHPWIDAQRVGITGHSGGGYAAARALMLFPEVFKVGVASAGNHDQRGYDAGWGEFWVGVPEGDNYEAQDNMRLAERLRGKLLLMHGEMDDNVHVGLTMRLVDALIAANRDFDLLLVPFTDHAFFDLRWGRDAAQRLPLPVHPYALRRRWDYLVTHLLATPPPPQYPLVADPADGEAAP
jgi:dipeptidyl aminopeptidase/acylaminoacyl peptidase